MNSLEKVRERAKKDAKIHGYFLNPDPELLHDLLEGLKKNEEHYGYPLCPCRLANGNFNIDRDIICPCDYRDPDIEEFGTCYCSLYVSEEVYNGNKKVNPIPERRPVEKQIRAYSLDKSEDIKLEEKIDVIKKQVDIKRKLFYCKQCGYLVFLEEPPYLCPICKAKREMFSQIKIQLEITAID